MNLSGGDEQIACTQIVDASYRTRFVGVVVDFTTGLEAKEQVSVRARTKVGILRVHCLRTGCGNRALEDRVIESKAACSDQEATRKRM